MSGSETGVMTSTTTTSREPQPFTVGLQKAAVLPSHSQPVPVAVVQNMRLAYGSDGTAVYKPVSAPSPSPLQTYQSSVTGSGGEGGSTVSQAQPQGSNVNMGSEPLKRKRGRPRKYGPDGSMALGNVTVNQSCASGAFSPSPPPSSPPSFKKPRGRPPGSSNSKKQQLESQGSTRVGFTPHVITVKAGEDVSSKIMSFSQHGPRAVCILSANGAISNVTLRQPATSGGTVTYEGRFEILSLSGSFLLSENGGQRSRTGGLSVSLSGPDGRVLGGGVAGLLTAASPVQVIVGSFIADGCKSGNPMEILSAPSSGLAVAGQSSSPSRESSGGPGSPLNQSTGVCINSNPQGLTSMTWK
ncbi:hypothetical protein L6164_024968 [Bauhinia variegata]|uniref:Uncharacterized protein n=1 Tax=Bauhinia variegata TaxID=167791 RepID=A0ACB9LZG8_BAUVA|nr:hypothetical protein L6164_024968 [Bauhinia variegata]